MGAGAGAAKKAKYSTDSLGHPAITYVRPMVMVCMEYMNALRFFFWMTYIDLCVCLVNFT